MLFIVDDPKRHGPHGETCSVISREGLEPDILLTGKALGNGHIAAVLSRTPLATEDLHGFAGVLRDDAVVKWLPARCSGSWLAVFLRTCNL